MKVRLPTFSRYNSARATLNALESVHAVVEFKPDGTIVRVNPAFLQATGYDRDEVIGRHHSIFVDAEVAAGKAYANFWSGLAEGRAEAGLYRRVHKSGRDVWLQSTYDPIRK